MNYCYDCGCQGELVDVPACADFDCCYKQVCKGECTFKCSKCEKKIQSSEGQQVVSGNDKVIIHCNECLDTKNYIYRTSVYGIPVWYGISEEEHFKRYCY